LFTLILSSSSSSVKAKNTSKFKVTGGNYMFLFPLKVKVRLEKPGTPHVLGSLVDVAEKADIIGNYKQARAS